MSSGAMGCGASASQLEQPAGSAVSWAKWRRRSSKTKVRPENLSNGDDINDHLNFEKTVSANADDVTTCDSGSERCVHSTIPDEAGFSANASPVLDELGTESAAGVQPSDENANGSRMNTSGDATSGLKPQVFEVLPFAHHEEAPSETLSKTPSKSPSNASMAEKSESSQTEIAPEAVDPSTPTHEPAISIKEIIESHGATNICAECFATSADIYQDPSDSKMYCESCWIDYYGIPPRDHRLPKKLCSTAVFKVWKGDNLIWGWAANPVSSWPSAPSTTPKTSTPLLASSSKGAWSAVKIMVHPDIVGLHARETEGVDRPHHQDILAEQYRVDELVGHGHFTRAFLATDITSGNRVCVKAHHNLKVDNITDMLCIDHKLQAVDPNAEVFPRLLDSFYDINGYTVETLIEGRNCLELRQQKPKHFTDMRNVHVVAHGVLEGLVLLAKVGIVHCDLKPDNIMWTQSVTAGAKPVVRLVDFGCSRLDRRLENGRNWSLAEGGAGHMGKWALEMFLRLPITDRADVWGLAVTLLELISKRAMWCAEEDTEELMLAQLLGLAMLRDGMPKQLLQRSPIDITRHYTPPPRCFPIRNLANAGEPNRFEEFRPSTWGLEGILGDEAKWDAATIDFAEYIFASFTADPEDRPSAEKLLTYRFLAEGPVTACAHMTTDASAVGPEARALFFGKPDVCAASPKTPASFPANPSLNAMPATPDAADASVACVRKLPEVNHDAPQGAIGDEPDANEIN